MTLNEYGAAILDNAIAHGFYDGGEPPIGERLCLIHAELSEALEELRDGWEVGEIYFVEDKNGEQKPEGVAIELCDALIRILDVLTFYGVDIDAAVQTKMDYNAKRPYKHGGKKF